MRQCTVLGEILMYNFSERERALWSQLGKREKQLKEIAHEVLVKATNIDNDTAKKLMKYRAGDFDD